MENFEAFKLPKLLNKGFVELGYSKPTPIQVEAYPVVSSGKDVVGIAQTGTGKTLAYLLPILKELKYSNQSSPRVLILVPTRELVLQVVDFISLLSKYMNLRTLGVYGGANINVQKKAALDGLDIVVATPGRLYDLALSRAIKLKDVRKLVIDEVDVMLDLGFRFQLNNIFELLSTRRQNIMFSATMTEEIDALINDYFTSPKKIAIAISGTRLDNIEQTAYAVENFYTKKNLVIHLLKDKETFHKVLIFVANKKHADRLFESLEEDYKEEMCVIHSNKTQNYRIRSIRQFDEGFNRILISTDVMARGLDLDRISHVINLNVPTFPENYMHRIGRTGRAEEPGKAILFYTNDEIEAKEELEKLMNYQIPEKKFPEAVEVSEELLPEERPEDLKEGMSHKLQVKKDNPLEHQKKEKNSKENQGGSYRQKIAEKYKKPRTRGDKNYNRRNKKR